MFSTLLPQKCALPLGIMCGSTIQGWLLLLLLLIKLSRILFKVWKFCPEVVQTEDEQKENSKKKKTKKEIDEEINQKLLYAPIDSRWLWNK